MAEDLPADPAVVPPPEETEALIALRAAAGEGVGHPQTARRGRPRGTSVVVQEDGQRGRREASEGLVLGTERLLRHGTNSVSTLRAHFRRIVY